MIKPDKVSMIFILTLRRFDTPTRLGVEPETLAAIEMTMVKRWKQIPMALAGGTLLIAGLELGGQSPAARPQTPAVLPAYADVTDQAGINFHHSYGEKKLSSIMEATGSGCAWLDYNNDGLLDLYVASGRYLEGVTKFSTPQGEDATNHLYRHNADGTFTDVTHEAGVPGKGFGTDSRRTVRRTVLRGRTLPASGQGLPNSRKDER